MRCLWPSDLKIWLFTLTIIVVPSFFCIYITIWGCQNNEDFDTNAKIFLTIIYCLSLLICLWSLFMVTFTEPGILPSIFMNTKITNIESKKINVYKDYYCEYKNRQELNEMFDELKIKNTVDKYYNLNKFKYLEALRDDHGQL